MSTRIILGCLIAPIAVFQGHGDPIAADGAPFVLVATNSSSIELFGLTSDSQGRVYAGNNSNGNPGIPAQVFSPGLFTGTPIAFQNLGPSCRDADGITFGDGYIFIADADSGVQKVSVTNGASGLFLPGVATNPTGSPLVYRQSDGHLFVGLGGLTGIDRIDEYDANGSFVKSHTTGTDVETMTFDSQHGLIYYAPFGSTVRVLNPTNDDDLLVGNVDGTIDGGLAWDPLSQLLFVGTANGSNPGIVETIDVSSGKVTPFATGFSVATGIIREPTSGNLYFLTSQNLYELGTTNVNQSFAPVGLAIVVSNSVATTTWQVVASNSYQLQFTAQLGAPAWTNIGSVQVAMSNRLNLIDFAATNLQGFYRALLVP